MVMAIGFSIKHIHFHIFLTAHSSPLFAPPHLFWMLKIRHLSSSFSLYAESHKRP